MNLRGLKLYRAYSISFNSSLNCWQILLELNSKGLYQSSGKEKESCCLVFPSSTKREISHFHVVVVQQRQRNVQKSVIHVQSCCLANQKPVTSLPFSLTSPSSLLMLSFKIPRRRRRQKGSLNSDFAIYETLARLSQLGHYELCRRTLLELNS